MKLALLRYSICSDYLEFEFEGWGLLQLGSRDLMTRKSVEVCDAYIGGSFFSLFF